MEKTEKGGAEVEKLSSAFFVMENVLWKMHPVK